MRRDQRGQALTELALVLPILVLLVFGIVELGTAFNHAMTISAATREAARAAGAFVNGGGTLGCGAGQSPNRAQVDPLVVAGLQRVLTASNTQLPLADVLEIRIFKATATGAETAGLVNTWTYQQNGGPMVAGDRLDYVEQTNGWNACARNNVNPADSVGVTIRYLYRGRTPLRFLVPGLLATLPVNDTTVMPLNASR